MRFSLYVLAISCMPLFVPSAASAVDKPLPWSDYGINGYARLALYPLVHIEDVFVRPSVSKKTLAYDVWIANLRTHLQRFWRR